MACKHVTAKFQAEAGAVGGNSLAVGWCTPMFPDVVRALLAKILVHF